MPFIRDSDPNSAGRKEGLKYASDSEGNGPFKK